MPRPLSRTHPYVIERHDQEDGSINYEIWDYRPDTYHRLCTVNEDPVVLDTEVPEEGRGQAKEDAELIVRALNLMNGGLPNG